MSPVLAFVVVIVPLFYAVAIATSPIAAKILRGWRYNRDAPAAA
jgi:hypothetical protein